MISSERYEMDWATGKLVPCTIAPKLARGQKLYDVYRGCTTTDFCVTNPETGEAVAVLRKEYVKDNLDVLVYHGEHEREDEWSCHVRGRYDAGYIKPISKQFGIGWYYAENEPMYTEEDIMEFEECAKMVEAHLAKLERERKENNEKKRANFLKEYSYLTQVTNHYDEKEAAKNLRLVLKKRFPKTKFSVAKSGGSYYVEWMDGVTEAMVKEVTGMFKTGRFDGYEDYAYSVSSEFTRLYGGIEYIWVKRKYSEEQEGKMRAELIEMCPVLADMQCHKREEIMPILVKYKVDTHYWGSSLNEIVRQALHDIDLTPKEEEKEVKIETSGEYTIIDYSEKAIALIGDTKSIKDELKKLGGRFNPRLTCGAGWVFSKTKESELKSLLNL